ncbi:MAG: hypothetical protein R2939_02610 [Kofleriaceae bacterium]
MKKCVACQKDLPDAAAHCVFCGGKQPAQPAAPPMDRTVMGYSASDLIANLPPGAVPGAVGAPPSLANAAMAETLKAPTKVPSEIANAPSPSLQRPRTAPPLQPQQPHSGLSSASLPLPSGLGGAPPAQHHGLPGFAPPAQPGVLPQHLPPPAQPTMPLAAGGPPAVGMPQPAAPQVGPMAGAIPMAPANHPAHERGAGPGATMPLDPAIAAAPVPLAMAKPPVRGRVIDDPIPVVPYAGGLRLVLVVFGVLLIGAFLTPIRMTPTTLHWDALVSAPSTLILVSSLLLVVGGALALAIALIPMPDVARGVAAVAIGLTAMLMPMTLGDAPAWQSIALMVGSIAMIPGLLLRHVHRGSLAARMMVTLGALAILAAFLAPGRGDQVPLIAAFEALGTNRTLPAIFILVPALLALLSLMCWLPASSSALGKPLAWTWVMVPVIGHFLVRLEAGHFSEMAKAAPYPTLAAWVPAAAWILMIGYGVAVAIGSRLRA